MNPPAAPGTLIVVDPDVTLGNPALKAMVKALPALLDAGWEIRIWSSRFDAIDNRLHWESIPVISKIGFIQFLFLSVYSCLRYGSQRLRKRIPQGTLIQSSGASFLFANVVNIQFVSNFYLEMVRRFPGQTGLRKKEYAIHSIAGCLERLMWRMKGRRRAWIVCSEQLAIDLEKKVGGSDHFEILPNSYDPATFNHARRARERAVRRTSLGLQDHELVFGFVCLGGFDRKGLPSALKICRLLIEKGLPCRLLVIGGTSSAPPDVAEYALKAGVSDFSFVLPLGRSDEVPGILSAADALLFPSFFEAFANVEIEAAALGLRLYLTPHYGSEMIIRPGANGRLIPWDPVGAAALIAAEILDGSFYAGAIDCGKALPDSHFAHSYLAALQRIQLHLQGGSIAGPAAVSAQTV